MLSVTEVCKRYKAGEALTDLIPQDADPKYWQRIVDNYSERPRRKRAPRRQNCSKRTNYAAQVIKRNAATLELVKRANGGKLASDDTERSQREWEAQHPDFDNGLGAGVDY